jgi:Fe-S cluster assembly protein SufD
MNFAALTPAAERLAAQSPHFLAELRQQALARFLESGLPSPRQEAWKYTNLAQIERKSLSLVQTAPTIDADSIRAKLLADCWHLVLVDGKVSEEFSRLPNRPQQAIVLDLKTALCHHPELIAQGLGQAVDQPHGLIDLNTVLFQDGAFIYLKPQVKLEPIQILHLHTQAALIPTRHLIVLEEGAQACVIETYLGTADGLAVHVSEALLGEHSYLQHFKTQQEQDQAFHFGGLYVKQAANSCFRQAQFALGGRLARSEIHVRLEQNSRCELQGLHWAKGQSHLDSHTLIVHTAPGATSREVYKAIAEDRGRSVFQGRIVVQPGAQKTDAAMENRNLLLSEAAEVDSQPHLEIYADDVKCSHGVSIGQLDQDALFYLKTRGLELEAARELLLYGFANAMIAEVPLASLRAFLHRQVDQHFTALNLETAVL